jgi:hypothetical protein
MPRGDELRPFLTDSGARIITPDQIEGAVWSAIIHEARGLACAVKARLINSDGVQATIISNKNA